MLPFWLHSPLVLGAVINVDLWRGRMFDWVRCLFLELTARGSLYPPGMFLFPALGSHPCCVTLPAS